MVSRNSGFVALAPEKAVTGLIPFDRVKSFVYNNKGSSEVRVVVSEGAGFGAGSDTSGPGEACAREAVEARKFTAWRPQGIHLIGGLPGPRLPRAH
jgi:hypothetical protein